MKKGKLIALILSGIFLTGTVAGCRKADTRALTPQEYTYLNLSGTDALGRRIQPGAARKEGEKYVGHLLFALARAARGASAEHSEYSGTARCGGGRRKEAAG